MIGRQQVVRALIGRGHGLRENDVLRMPPPRATLWSTVRSRTTRYIVVRLRGTDCAELCARPATLKEWWHDIKEQIRSLASR